MTPSMVSERDYTEVADRLDILVRDEAGYPVHLVASDRYPYSSDSDFRMVSDVASGDAPMTVAARKGVSRVASEFSDASKVYLAAMARRRISRGKMIADFVEQVEETLFDPRRLQYMRADDLRKLWSALQDEEMRTTEYVRDLSLGKAQLEGASQDTPGNQLHLHLHQHAQALEKLPPYQRERLRTLASALLKSSEEGG